MFSSKAAFRIALLLDLYRYAGKCSVYLKGSFIKSTQSPWHRKNVAHHVGAGPEKLIYSVAEACPLSHTPDFCRLLPVHENYPW